MYVIEQAAVNEQQNGQYSLPVLEASVHVTQHTNMYSTPFRQATMVQMLYTSVFVG